MGMWRNITERGPAGRTLPQEEQRLEDVTRCANCGLLLLDGQAKVTFANKLAQEWFEPLQELRGRLCSEALDLRDPQRECAALQVLRTGETARGDDFIKLINGEERWFHLVASPVKDEAGRIQQITGIVVDVTERTLADAALRESELKFQTLFEMTLNPILLLDDSGRCIGANQAALGFLECDRNELLGKEVWEFAPPGLLERQKQEYPPFASLRAVETEFYVHGKIKTLVLTVVPVSVSGRTVLYGMGHNITRRKQAEQRQKLAVQVLELLNRSEEKVKSIRNILLLVKEFTGLEAVGLRLREGEDFPYYETSGFPADFVEAERYLCVRDADGEPVLDSEGKPYLECMCGNVLCGRTDPALPFFTEGGSFWTNSTSDLLASTREEDRQAPTRNRCNEEGYESVALMPLRSDSEVVGLLQLSDRRRAMFTPEMIGFFEGIGDSIGIALARKRVEEALQTEREQLLSIFDSMDEVVYASDPETYELLYVNEAFRKRWGSAIGRKCHQVLQRREAPCPFCTNDRIFGDNAGNTVIWEFQNQVDKRWYRCIDRAIHWSDGRLIRFEMAIDITKSKQAAEETYSRRAELAHASRLSVMGEMASGLAHELNQPLCGILSAAQGGLRVLDGEASGTEQLEPVLRHVETQARRAGDIIRHMRDFASKREARRTPVDLNEVVREAVSFVEAEARRNGITVRLTLAHGLPPVLAEAIEIQQVILNLVRNGFEAMADVGASGHTLTIKTSMTQGGKVEVAVQDEGCGLPVDILEEAFKSFFTTKPAGMGIGLSISRTIIEAHGGRLWAAPNLQRGTTFRFQLPVVEEAVENGHRANRLCCG